MKKMTYYDIRNDLKRFPDAWCYLIWSSRGPGKTYSTLRSFFVHPVQDRMSGLMYHHLFH